MILTDKIYIAGHKGLIGSAIFRRLEAEGFSNIITREHSELDLRTHFGVYAGTTKKYQLFGFVQVSLVDDIALHHQIFIYELSSINIIGVHTAYFPSGEKHVVWFFLYKEPLNLLLQM